MAQVLVRDVAPDVIDRLKERAAEQGRSLEAELRIIMQEAAAPHRVANPAEEARKIREMFGGRTFSDSTEMLREDRSR